MNQDHDHPNIEGGEPTSNHPTVEQSWIVLDDAGWVSGSSRPPTASPSRKYTATRTDNDGDEDFELRVPRRIGMDRDVREALELAERSLELAGSSDEFSRRFRGNSDDDSTVRSSPASIKPGFGGIFVDDAYEDKYNGRAPPTIGARRGGGIVISTDSEHVAFQNIKVVGSSSRPETPLSFPSIPSTSSSSFKDVVNKVQQPSSSINNSNRSVVPNPASNDNDVKAEDDGELSFFQWAFGVSNSNLVPLVFSHVVTLLVGIYIGSRRSSSHPNPPTPSTVSTTSQCSATTVQL